MTEPPQVGEIRRSSRDPEAVRTKLEEWLSAKTGTPASVTELHGTSASGMSSETLLFHAEWNAESRELVARLAPDPADAPVFPEYDMDRQFRIIRTVGELSDVPVPDALWSEGDPSVLGTPFFVMGRIDGDVPPDVMPYNFGDSWPFAASREDQQRLQDASVAVLAGLHAIDPSRFAFCEFDVAGDTPLRRHVAHTRAWYEYGAAAASRSPLIERGLQWLDEHWPSETGAVLSWGDARIGNVLYRDFEPVAVLDWEMAGLGPRELDVGWMIYAHRAFEDMAHAFGMQGMPDFMRPDDVAATYESLTGAGLKDLDFYIAYAAVQWGIVFLRTGARAVRFGERTMPDDVDDLLYNREPLARLVG
jgi:aminoglycoside phosphotransferase (APT) family kinase protein